MANAKSRKITSRADRAARAGAQVLSNGGGVDVLDRQRVLPMAHEIGVNKAAPAVQTFDTVDGIASVARQVLTSKLFVPSYHGIRDPRNNSHRAARLHNHLQKAGGFDWRLYEPIAVNYVTKEDRYSIIDGVGRWFMATALTSPAITSLKAEVYVDLSLREQIRIYRARMSERTLGKLVDNFLADFTNPDVKAIRKSVSDADFVFVGQGGGKKLRISIHAARFSYELGVIDVVLNHIRNTAWGSKGLTSSHIAALAAVLATHENIDQKRVRDVLDCISPLSIQTDAFHHAIEKRGILKPQGRHIAWAIAEKFVDRYNHSLVASKRLHHDRLVFESEYPDTYWPYVPGTGPSFDKD